MTEAGGIYAQNMSNKNPSSFLLCLGDWYPAVIFDIIDEELKGTIELGKALLITGDLESAKVAFIRCHGIIERLDHYQKMRYDIEIRAQLAGIKLLGSSDREAQEDFNAVLCKMSQVFSTREINVVKRWVAASSLHQGEYQKAAQGFEALLHNLHGQTSLHAVSIAEPSIRRDLALVYAYQRYHHHALVQIEIARNRLHQLTHSHRVPNEAGLDMSTLAKTSEATTSDIYASNSEVMARNPPISPSETIVNEYSVEGDYLYLPESKINCMQGNFRVALNGAGNALCEMTKKLGAYHFKTLECASQHSMLFALNSHISEARIACTVTLGFQRHKLGAQHPQTLETVAYFVSILLLESRLVEAGDTAMSLAKTTESALTADHPQTYRSSYSVAETLFAVGDYASAEVQLERVIGQAKSYTGNATRILYIISPGLPSRNIIRTKYKRPNFLPFMLLKSNRKSIILPIGKKNRQEHLRLNQSLTGL